MTSNVCGIMPICPFQYPSGDFDYIDLAATTYPMTTDTSIFGGGFPMMGASGGSLFGDNQSYYDNLKQQQQFYNQYYIDQQRMQRNADLRLNGAMEAISEAATNLKDKILQNEQDQIKEAYDKYIEAVANAYGEGSQEEINSRALSMYQRMNNGKGLVEDLRENSHSSFVQGLLQTLTFGAYYNKSAEDNISEITGLSVGEGEKTMQNLGRFTGTAAIGTGAYATVKSLSGKTGAIARAAQKIFKGKAAWVGAITATIAGAITFINGKIST